MSIQISSTQITSTKIITERTYQATQFCPDGNDYYCSLKRERKTEIEGVEPSYSRSYIAPIVGEPNEGTDGTDPAHYGSAQVGFEPEITVSMNSILAIDPAETITIQHPNPAVHQVLGDITVPACIVPLLLSEIFDLVASKTAERVLGHEIDLAVLAKAASLEE